MTEKNTCCEKSEEQIVMDKLESNKMLANLNSKCIKYGILKYGSLVTLVISIIVIFTADTSGANSLGWFVAVVSLIAHIAGTLFRKKYKATVALLLKEYKIQVHDIRAENE